MTWMPFACIAAGFVIGFRNLSEAALKLVDGIITVALVALMLTIGMNIGVNDSVMKNLSAIGLHCVVISLLAIGCSMLFMVLAEKTVVPLESMRAKLYDENMNINDEVDVSAKEEKKTSALIWVMPVSIVAGVLFGYFLLPGKFHFVLSPMLTVSLIVLYTGVGVSLGTNRKVFRYIKVLGFKVLYLSLAILVGSLVGGLLAGMLLGIPFSTSMLSAGGMSYYSITGAYMTQVYGIEAGTYGFVVNVMREFFTVLLLPLLIKISKGSPIASGAAGNMDTMLVPVTRFVGAELGLVALVTGAILTFAVPFLLPVFHGAL